MLQSFTFWTSVLVVLIVYLCLSVGLRWLREERACARGERHYPPGNAFEVSTLSPRVQRVRQDHVAALHSRSQPAFHRPRLIDAARRMVTSFSYFRRARFEDESQKHEAE